MQVNEKIGKFLCKTVIENSFLRKRLFPKLFQTFMLERNIEDFRMTAEAYALFYSHRHFFLIYTSSSNLLLSTMVRTRSQLEILSKEQLIDEVLSLYNFKNDINMNFSEINDPC